MTLTTQATAEGYVHEIGFYASDSEFADQAMPFAREGLRTGEPVVFAYDDYKTQLLQQWLPDHPAITYITDTGPYSTPAKALGAWRELVQQHLTAGAARVRIAGNVPHPGYGTSYAGWDRYEAAIDGALGDLPVWAPCLYDVRIAPPVVVQRARALHHHVRDRNGTSRVNDGYRRPTRLADFLPAPPDPIEANVPVLELIDPMPGPTRTALARLVAGRVNPDRADSVVLAASEAVTNAIIHGTAPVSVRAWVGDDRVVVAIHDTGSGPHDALVGLHPGEIGADSGRGLWIAHQLDLDVALRVDADGFTVRLRTQLG
jgi:anti-sigma regulatory factor (Ser/Thr protein kinase)